MTAVVSLDIKKAFDSVWQQGLVYKLAVAMQTSGNALRATKVVEKYCKAIRGYLTNWGIELNEEKTDFMIVSRRRK